MAEGKLTAWVPLLHAAKINIFDRSLQHRAHRNLNPCHIAAPVSCRCPPAVQGSPSLAPPPTASDAAPEHAGDHQQERQVNHERHVNHAHAALRLSNNDPASESSGSAALLSTTSDHSADRLPSGYAIGSAAISVAAIRFCWWCASRTLRTEGGRRLAVYGGIRFFPVMFPHTRALEMNGGEVYTTVYRVMFGPRSRSIHVQVSRVFCYS